MTHHFPLRVYYEDTDLAGIVYYANYLKFIERGRSEWVRDLGIDQSAMKRDECVVFAVRKVDADYHSPAKYDDELVVVTDVEIVTGARLILRQTVQRDAKILFTARVTIVAINDAGAPARLPAAFRRIPH